MKWLGWIPPRVSKFIYTVILYPRPLRVAAQIVIKRMIPETLDVEGVRLVLNRDDAVLCGALALGSYERFELQLFKALLRPGMNVLDIGANIGLFSSAAASILSGNGRVIAVEPDADNCAFLQRTIELNHLKNVAVLQRAASDRCGIADLFICPDNKADHRIYGEGARTRRKTVPIQTVTVDSIVETEGLVRVDLIKIDIQGAEALAFDGMQKTIRENQNIIILTEFWPWGLTQTRRDPAALLRTFREYGFKFYEIDSDNNRLPLVADDAALTRQNRERQHMNLLLYRGDVHAILPEKISA